jgi:hypothetical protein
MRRHPTPGRLTRAIDYGIPTITWAKDLADLDRARTNPQQAVQRAVAALQAIATSGPVTAGGCSPGRFERA